MEFFRVSPSRLWLINLGTISPCGKDLSKGLDSFRINKTMSNKLNPHNSLMRLEMPPLDFWECRYCKKQGSYDELQKIACDYKYPACKYCGETPLCAEDCEGIAKALASANVYLINEN